VGRKAVDKIDNEVLAIVDIVVLIFLLLIIVVYYSGYVNSDVGVGYGVSEGVNRVRYGYHSGFMYEGSSIEFCE
jgi:hypothetical protein